MRTHRTLASWIVVHGTILAAASAASAQTVFGTGVFDIEFKWVYPCNPNTNLGASKDIDLGTYHGVTLSPSGVVACWNNGFAAGNAFGQSTVPGTLGVVLDVDAGFTHNVALKSNGRVACWGRNQFNQCIPPIFLDNVVAVSAGGDFSLALRSNGEIWSWGDNQFDQGLPPIGTYTQISAGDYHGVARRSDDTVVAWGLNGNGQCDVPAGFTSPNPNINILKVAGGGAHSVVLYQIIGAEIGNGIYIDSFGWNNYGQCADFEYGAVYTDVAAGLYHTVALRENGTVECRGNNWWGQSDTVPNTVSRATKVAAGWFSTAMLRVDNDCGTGSGCYQQHGGRGCSNSACCAQVCSLDPYCCDTQWDSICANEAATICGGCGTGVSCYQPHATPGCANQTCCTTICALDPFCCDTQWDSICVNGANASCKLGDLNGDNLVNAADLSTLLSKWGQIGSGDLNGDGTTNAADLSTLLSKWGT